MTLKTKPKVGDKVTYVAEHCEPENGIVKEVRENIDDAVWVVYHCGGMWNNFRNYTGAKTNLRDLKMGWHCGIKD